MLLTQDLSSCLASFLPFATPLINEVFPILFARSSIISTAIAKCCNDTFRLSIKNIENPYGLGGTADAVINLLAKLDLSSFNIKTFTDHDIDE